MSCSYGAIALIGISVPLSEVREVIKTQKRLCDHPLPNPSVKFCPECGKRTYITVSKYKPLKGFSDKHFPYNYDNEPLRIGDHEWAVVTDPDFAVVTDPDFKEELWLGVISSGVVYAPGEPKAIQSLNPEDQFNLSQKIEYFIEDMKSIGLWKNDYVVKLWVIPYLSC